MTITPNERRIVAAIPGGGYVFNERVGDRTASVPVLCWLVYEDGDVQAVDCLGDHLKGSVAGPFKDWPAVQPAPVGGRKR
ncbi:hypothetical protein EF910_31960 [Streptomyces sp. WAC07149]|uniref:hypothetical protein n=1 Tax=Streptomyces sp. WAC07149 TaxID=2487425 RepID=UPI000F789ECB|nr:hypothetical protein [Streptomyces sp. WAC07149]RST00353.1 hypothetical protein EF910_31960 [Streptomyces sp. WAC07149]